MIAQLHSSAMNSMKRCWYARKTKRRKKQNKTQEHEPACSSRVNNVAQAIADMTNSLQISGIW